jgi:magnesium transporter
LRARDGAYWEPEVQLENNRSQGYFLSELLGKRVRTSSGDVVGKVWDLVVDLELPEPSVVRLFWRRSWSLERWGVNWADVSSIDSSGITLRSTAQPALLSSGRTFSLPQIFLRDFLLDKQIVDINGAKVVRVNDLQFARTNGDLRLAQVDVGLRGMLRRLGCEHAVVSFLQWFFDYTIKDRFISWNYVQPLADPDRLRLQVPQSKLADLHPADLADIIEDMDVHERAAVVAALSRDVLADALEEMEPKVLVSIIKGMEPEAAADVIEEMSPDEAADLIADLPEETASGILREMDHEYGRQVKGLLVHEDDEAGGLMTTQFVSVSPDQSILDALACIRQNVDKIDVIYYAYVVDAEARLVGVVNLRELLSKDIFTPLRNIMTTRLITAKLDDSAEDLADLFAKYGFRAIPVVDLENRIKGVIRFKALLEILAPHLGA